VNYNEFLKQPEIETKFVSMFNEQRKHFFESCSKGGFDKSHLELVSIKAAMISTDIYFSELHKSKNPDEEA
jgi:hypothetical protein